MAKDFTELWGRKFEIVKNGLSEDEVVSYVSELNSEHEKLAQRQEHLVSLTKLAEKTVTEAEKLAEEIKREATEEAKAEAAKLVSEAEAQAEKSAEEKRNEIVTAANNEADNIKANAEREAASIIERQKKKIYPELKSMAQVVHDQLLSDLQNLNKQVAAMGEEFERKLAQFAEQTGNPAEVSASAPQKITVTTDSGSKKSLHDTIEGLRHLIDNTNKYEIVSKQITVPTSAQSGNIIINHTNCEWYNSQPQGVFDRVATQKIYFAYASLGRNIMEGFGALHSAKSSKYPLSQKSAGETPPSTTFRGTIYEYPRGNPGWSEKVSNFEAHINNGWHDTKVDMVMNKFCYIDQNADWTVYRDSMTALEAKYPGTKFVYWTIPITRADGAEAILRNQFNQNLRNWIATQNNKLLFDIADIEAWSPNGEHQTFTDNGTVYEKIFLAYTSDGGHLNAEGSLRMATGLYSLFGQVISPLHTP